MRFWSGKKIIRNFNLRKENFFKWKNKKNNNKMRMFFRRIWSWNRKYGRSV